MARATGFISSKPAKPLSFSCAVEKSTQEKDIKRAKEIAAEL
jgi:hypothetical protein